MVIVVCELYLQTDIDPGRAKVSFQSMFILINNVFTEGVSEHFKVKSIAYFKICVHYFEC